MKKIVFETDSLSLFEGPPIALKAPWINFVVYEYAAFSYEVAVQVWDPVTNTEAETVLSSHESKAEAFESATSLFNEKMSNKIL